MAVRQTRYRGRYCGIIFWLLLVVTSALEVYDDLPPRELDQMVGQDDLMENMPDAEPKLYQPRDLLLYQWVKSLQGDDRHVSNYRPQRLSTHPNSINQFLNKNGLDTIERDSITKRLTEGMRHSGTKIIFNPVQNMRPQQKWKTKKGKTTGSLNMVCYFKLCAFRSPFGK